jgi:hypothetical protein
MRKTTVIVLVLAISLLAPAVIFGAENGEDVKALVTYIRTLKQP